MVVDAPSEGVVDGLDDLSDGNVAYGHVLDRSASGGIGLEAQRPMEPGASHLAALNKDIAGTARHLAADHDTAAAVSHLALADHDILDRRGIKVLPDILANAGGVTASYFEWVQDRQGYFWKETVVNEQLETILRDSFDDVVRYAEAHNVNNRIAAYMLAIDRVAFTIRQRGIYA